ncbi:MAG: Crp/Fnr family transcriptional regulator [Flavobacteriaceae bacterium]
MIQDFQTYLKTNAGVTNRQLEQLQDLIFTKTYEKGELLLDKGQICRHTFFVEEGLLRFFSISEEGKEHIIQFAPEGWFVSERNSICFNEPSEYFIDACERTTVALMSQEFVEKASRVSPQFRMYNERILQNHIRQLQKRIKLLIGSNAEERYLDFVRLYPDLMLRVPQWMIASYLGITPESLSRVRKNLVKG